MASKKAPVKIAPKKAPVKKLHSRKCPKCGTELGQKNLCPVCSKLSQSKTEKTAKADAGSKSSQSKIEAGNPSGNNGAYSSELANLLEPFVKSNLQKWNLKFDDFYETLQGKAKKDVNYPAAVAQCKRWTSIFTEIQNMIGNKRTITADLMIEIMEKIPQKFPEISDKKARTLAREFYQKNVEANRRKSRKNKPAAKKAAPAKKNVRSKATRWHIEKN